MNRAYKKNRPASKPNLSFEFAEDKVNILSLLHPAQNRFEESESSSTESMKWVGSGDKCRLNNYSCNARDKGIDRFQAVSKKESGGLDIGKNAVRQGSGKGYDESEGTVVRNNENGKKRLSGSLGGRSELSKSMMEILRKQNFCENSRDALKFQTRLQVLKVFRQECCKD